MWLGPESHVHFLGRRHLCWEVLLPHCAKPSARQCCHRWGEEWQQDLACWNRCRCLQRNACAGPTVRGPTVQLSIAVHVGASAAVSMGGGAGATLTTQQLAGHTVLGPSSRQSPCAAGFFFPFRNHKQTFCQKTSSVCGASFMTRSLGRSDLVALSASAYLS